MKKLCNSFSRFFQHGIQDLYNEKMVKIQEKYIQNQGKKKLPRERTKIWRFIMLKLNLDKMEKTDISIDALVSDLNNLATRLKQLHGLIEKDSYGSNTEKVKNKIEKYYKQTAKEAKAVENMGIGLEKATVKYHNMENDVVAFFTSIHQEKVTMSNNSVDRKAAKQSHKNVNKKDKINASLYKKEKSTKDTKSSTSASYISTDGKASSAAQKAAKYALSQVGIKETGNNHTKYNKWYFGSNKSAMWCGTFALYCADQAGLIGKGKPIASKDNLAGIGNMIKYYKGEKRYQSKTSGYTPKQGDMAFFTSRYSNSGYHVGMVTGYDAKTKTVTVVEGNKSDQVKKSTYKLNGKNELIGFGENTIVK